ncbi:GFA family protein [Aestuariivita sp.]|uniref:GFA family protein n=1 Tax=Aestuariivita sp. TaxID=1872407 RepID=UPI00342A9468
MVHGRQAARVGETLMAETTQLSGSCMCGACSFTATPSGQGAGACHCGMCRHWSGGIFMSVDCGNSVEFAEGSPVKSYKASDWGERLFCGECGSSLVWQLQDGSMQNASIQCFDKPGQFDLSVEVFIDNKPANYALAGERNTMTEAEVIALFAQNAEGQS